MEHPVMLVRATVRRPKASYDERLDGSDIIEDGDEILVQQYFVVVASDRSQAKQAVTSRCRSEDWVVEKFHSFEQRVEQSNE